jgi:hypothetical protein
MRQAGTGVYADRTRGLIAILRRAGLRISEALALTESDLDPKTGSVLVRSGKGGKRRMVGMDDWAWEHVARWTEHRVQLPRPAVLRPRRTDPRARLVSYRRARRASPPRRAGRGESEVCAASAPPRARDRDGPRRDPAADHPASARACPSRDHLDLPPRDRHARDRRHRPSAPTAGHPGQRRPAAITQQSSGRVERPAHRRPGAPHRGPERSRPCRRPHDWRCPIPTTSVPAAPLLLYCLQDSVARLAPSASSSPMACSRAPCTRPALSGGVRTGGDGREPDRWQVGGGPGAIDFSLDCVCRTTG